MLMRVCALISRNIVQHTKHHVTHAPANFEVTKFNGLGDTRKYSFCPLTLTLGLRSHEMLPNTPYKMDLCTYNV